MIYYFHNPEESTLGKAVIIMSNELHELMEKGFETACIDKNRPSSTSIRPQFLSNDFKAGRKVLSAGVVPPQAERLPARNTAHSIPANIRMECFIPVSLLWVLWLHPTAAN